MSSFFRLFIASRINPSLEINSVYIKSAPLSLHTARNGGSLINPALVRETGVDPILKYLASDRADEIDTQIVGSLQNFLFGAPGQGGFDLAALNIQRGRDHGLADYNTTRAAYGLPKVTSFAQITSDPALQQQLRTLYGDVNKIDLWVGGLAEDHTPGGNVGPTFTRIIADQFTRLRDGDRFYYENVFQGPQLTELRNTKLSDVLKRNTGLKNLQPNVFIFRTSIEGRVFGDRNRDGQWNGPEMGLGLRIVELVDAEGAVVATAQTRPDGSFRFEGMPLGSYQVREVLPPGTVSTTPPKPIVINKGMKVVGINVGEAPAARPAAPPASRPAAPPASAAPTDSKVVASSSSSLTINGSLLNDSLLNS